MFKQLTSLLMPAWLRRLDHYLLVSHPLLWASRIHYLAFYSLLSALLLAALFLLVPVSLNDLFLPEAMLSAVVVLGVVAALGWVRWRALYDGKQQFVSTGRRGDLWRLLINMACLLLIAANVLWARVLLNYRIVWQFSPQQLITDVNAMNRGATYICKYGASCEIAVVDSTFQEHRAERIGDCKKQSGGFREFDFVDEHLSEELKKQLLSEQQLAALALQPLSGEEQKKHIATYRQLIEKYRGYDSAVDWMAGCSRNWDLKYMLLGIYLGPKDLLSGDNWKRENIYRISHTQAYPLGLIRELLTEVFLLVFFAGLLSLIYQHLGLRSFAVSMAAFLLLSVITMALTVVFSNILTSNVLNWLLGPEKLSFTFRSFMFTWPLCYMAVSLLLFWFAQRISRAARYSRLKETALACSTVFAPLLLLFGESLLTALLEIYSLYIKNKELLYSGLDADVLLLAGILLFMLAFQPGLSRLYQKNKSLPL